jgi:hypothetical protein
MRAVRKIALLVTVVALLGACTTTTGGTGTATTTPTTPAPTDNGIAALPVADILTKTTTALKGASSVHIKGQINTGSENIGVDLTVNLARDGVGSLTINGQNLQVTKLGTQVYFKADAGFWEQNIPGAQGQAAATLLAGKYLSAPTTDPKFGSFASFFALVDQFDFATGAKSATATKGQTQTINGTPAIALVESGSDGGTLWVATQGDPFPVRLEGPPGQGSLDFTDYNKPLVISTPPADQTIDVTKLAGA